MKIDINGLTEEELVDLNHRVVERLRLMRQVRTHVAMLEYRIGERVSFEPDGRGVLVGVITRYNKKSVTVLTSSGESWRVAPNLLSKVDAKQSSWQNQENVISLPKRS
jgi:hypothetical protein